MRYPYFSQKEAFKTSNMNKLTNKKLKTKKLYKKTVEKKKMGRFVKIEFKSFLILKTEDTC